MKNSLIIWGTIFSASTIGAFSAAKSGYGLTKPMVKPLSIREGSVKSGTAHRRTRYFVGGGLHGGK